VSASGFFAVVTIDDERQVGQSTGVVPAATGATGIEFGCATGPSGRIALVRAGWPKRPQGSIKRVEYQVYVAGEIRAAKSAMR
jgi:hypothetical protein